MSWSNNGCDDAPPGHEIRRINDTDRRGISRGLRDVSYTNFDVGKDDSYTGPGRVAVYGRATTSAALQTYSSWTEVQHGLIRRKCRIHVLNHFASTKLQLYVSLLLLNFQVHRRIQVIRIATCITCIRPAVRNPGVKVGRH